jgi:flagellar assembly protein FliH
MATVISKNKLDSHHVGKYNFKIIALGNSLEEESEHTKSPTKEEPEKKKITDVDSSALSSSSKESLIESLMQKTDEMSSNFIKLQMKLESKEEEYKNSLIKAKEDAFTEGIEAGVAKALNDSELQLKSSAEMFAESIKKIEKSAKEFETALEAIKSDLMRAAVDIAHEVVKVELSENSNEIAKVLSDELLNELQSASQVTLKVNPKNHGAISEYIGKQERVSIISDSAVSEGGVVVISDAGNIDAQISKRFQRVKRAALSE